MMHGMSKRMVKVAKANYLKGVADNTPAGLNTLFKAQDELSEWCSILWEFAGLNPDTDPAKACNKTASEIVKFMQDNAPAFLKKENN